MVADQPCKRLRQGLYAAILLTMLRGTAGFAPPNPVLSRVSFPAPRAGIDKPTLHLALRERCWQGGALHLQASAVATQTLTRVNVSESPVSKSGGAWARPLEFVKTIVRKLAVMIACAVSALVIVLQSLVGMGDMMSGSADSGPAVPLAVSTGDPGLEDETKKSKRNSRYSSMALSLGSASTLIAHVYVRYHENEEKRKRKLQQTKR
jgi:hypothetical protein